MIFILVKVWYAAHQYIHKIVYLQYNKSCFCYPENTGLVLARFLSGQPPFCTTILHTKLFIAAASSECILISLKSHTTSRILLPVNSESGLQGAELICRWAAAAAVVTMGVTLKEAWRGILAVLRSWPSASFALFAVFPAGDDRETGDLRASELLIFKNSTRFKNGTKKNLKLELTRAVKLHWPEPLEGRLPSLLLPHVHLLDEAQAGQHVGDVVEPTHLGCGSRRRTVQTANIHTHITWPSLSQILTFVLAVARQVLALVDEGPGCCVKCDCLGLGHQEQHDELLAHDAQGFVFPIGASFRDEEERERLWVDDVARVKGTHALEVRSKKNTTTVVSNSNSCVSILVRAVSINVLIVMLSQRKQVFCHFHSPTVWALIRTAVFQHCIQLILLFDFYGSCRCERKFTREANWSSMGDKLTFRPIKRITV